MNEFQYLQTADSIARFKKLEEGSVACRAQSGDFRCCLDSIHQELGTSHVHRNDNGTLVVFRT
jgi:hypothetical protein